MMLVRLTPIQMGAGRVVAVTDVRRLELPKVQRGEGTTWAWADVEL
jgi:hypothetical protein